MAKSGPTLLEEIAGGNVDALRHASKEFDTRCTPEPLDLRSILERLKVEHRDLEAALAALMDTSGVDAMQVQRLKKRKLMLRDRITSIEEQLVPDPIRR
jgi:hypothetical protein